MTFSPVPVNLPSVANTIPEIRDNYTKRETNSVQK